MKRMAMEDPIRWFPVMRKLPTKLILPGGLVRTKASTSALGTLVKGGPDTTMWYNYTVHVRGTNLSTRQL